MVKIILNLLIVSVAVVLNFASIARAEIDPPVFESVFAQNLPNYIVVNPEVSRSGRPDQPGIRMIKDLGFRTVINIENDDQSIRREKDAVERLGLKYISSPMHWDERPNDRQMGQLLEALQNPRMHPILIHCKHGRDRTGLVIGLYRVFVDKWHPKKAYEEMLASGFRPHLKQLDRYFKEKTKNIRSE